MTNQTPEPDDLRALGAELDEARRRDGSRHKAPPPTPIGIAFRFSTEMVSALVVGGLIGWGLDWLFGTKPILMIVFFMLGAAAGIRNVMRAAKQLNARAAAENSEN
ncbi:MAG TPA: AtpZ/AtpI family protein [Gammaproteobacteria bacterium]|nr:AtpZ/AtpI family protein [Gammaproteobacteria bacterium]